jgi:hypothetical protein
MDTESTSPLQHGIRKMSDHQQLLDDAPLELHGMVWKSESVKWGALWPQDVRRSGGRR